MESGGWRCGPCPAWTRSDCRDRYAGCARDRALCSCALAVLARSRLSHVGAQVQAAGSRAASGGAMLGLMQEHPLIVSELLEYAVRVHGSREIVSRTIEDPSKVHRCVLHSAGRLQPAHTLSLLPWVAGPLAGPEQSCCVLARLSRWRCPLSAEREPFSRAQVYVPPRWRSHDEAGERSCRCV